MSLGIDSRCENWSSQFLFPLFLWELRSAVFIQKIVEFSRLYEPKWHVTEWQYYRHFIKHTCILRYISFKWKNDWLEAYSSKLASILILSFTFIAFMEAEIPNNYRIIGLKRIVISFRRNIYYYVRMFYISSHVI